MMGMITWGATLDTIIAVSFEANATDKEAKEPIDIIVQEYWS